jgi:hypothetical protein
MKTTNVRIAAVLSVNVIAAIMPAQNNSYKPFPENYGKWIVHEIRWGAPSCPHSDDYWQKYEMKGDTVVGAHSYKKVYVANSTGYPDANGVVPFGSSKFSFGYRNDSINKKVYYLIVSGGANKDTLWYDFNLGVGDTLANTYAYHGYSSTNERGIVSSIDSLTICGRKYKRFNFACQGGFNTSLVEGQGFQDRFFETAFIDCPFEPCTTFDTDFAHCKVDGITETGPENPRISLNPNPVAGLLTIKGEQSLIKRSEVLDSSGRLLLKQSSDTHIEVGSLSPGLYLLRINTTKGEVFLKFIKE